MIIVGGITIYVINLCHTFGPVRYLGPFYHAIKSKMPVSIGAFASFERGNPCTMWPLTPTGLLTMTAMNTPTRVSLGIFVTVYN
jgi:hypothetical protein